MGSSTVAAGHLTDSNLRDDLVYNTTTGNVQLQIPDLTGTGPIVQFSLRTDDSFDFTDGLVTQGLDCGLILPPVACGTESTISYDDPTNVGFEGLFDLGGIPPAGLSATGVQDFLTEASYRTASVSTLTEFDIHVVPEPHGWQLSVWAIAAVMAMLRRRKNWR